MNEAVPLYIPADIRDAQEEWSASCVPVALAAAIAVPVMCLEDLFQNFERKPWASGKQIEDVLRYAVARNWIERFDAIGLGVPNYGVMCVTCPDERDPIFDHAVAVAGDFVFDVNYASAWLPRAEWERVVLPLLNSFTSPRWRVVDGWEITRR